MRALLQFLRGMWRRPLIDVAVVLYTRRSCPLCDEAKQFLANDQRKLGFALTEIDIERSPDLCERFDQWVPVVEVNGQVRFRGVINRVLWRRLMQNLTRESQSPKDD